MKNRGSGIFTISWKYLLHLIKLRHRNGYGIHSPYVYDLVRNVIFNHGKIKAPEVAMNYHREMKSLNEQLSIADLGAGSRVTTNSRRRISSIVRRSSVSMKQGRLLHRLVNWYQPNSILEFGTGLGISTAYLAAGAQSANFRTIEGSLEKYLFVKKHMQEAGLKNVKLLQGDFNIFFPEILKGTDNRLFVFIDGDHRYKPTVEKVKTILEDKEKTEVILILDDIYWSNEMEQAWKECYSDQNVGISIDLFKFGILIRRPGIEKQHFRVSF